MSVRKQQDARTYFLLVPPPTPLTSTWNEHRVTLSLDILLVPLSR